jgi:hypothetical protein
MIQFKRKSTSVSASSSVIEKSKKYKISTTITLDSQENKNDKNNIHVHIDEKRDVVLLKCDELITPIEKKIKMINFLNIQLEPIEEKIDRISKVSIPFILQATNFILIECLTIIVTDYLFEPIHSSCNGCMYENENINDSDDDNNNNNKNLAISTSSSQLVFRKYKQSSEIEQHEFDGYCNHKFHPKCLKIAWLEDIKTWSSENSLAINNSFFNYDDDQRHQSLKDEYRIIPKRWCPNCKCCKFIKTSQNDSSEVINQLYSDYLLFWTDRPFIPLKFQHHVKFPLVKFGDIIPLGGARDFFIVDNDIDNIGSDSILYKLEGDWKIGSDRNIPKRFWIRRGKEYYIDFLSNTYHYIAKFQE